MPTHNRGPTTQVLLSAEDSELLWALWTRSRHEPMTYRVSDSGAVNNVQSNKKGHGKPHIHDFVTTKADLKPSGSRSTRTIPGYKGKKHTRTPDDSGFVEEGKRVIQRWNIKISIWLSASLNFRDLQNMNLSLLMCIPELVFILFALLRTAPEVALNTQELWAKYMSS